MNISVSSATKPADSSWQAVTRPDFGHYQAATTAIGWSRLDQRARLALVGPDARSFLHKFCTQHIDNMLENEIREAFLLDVKGRCVGYGHVIRHGDDLEFETEPEQTASLTRHLDRYIIREKVTIRDATQGTLLIGVVGPAVPDLLAAMGLPTPPSAPPRLQVWGQWQREPVAVRHRPRAWVSSADLVVPANIEIDFLARLRECAQPMGGMEIGPETWEVLRIESGLPAFGREVTPENLAQELDRTDQAIHFSKGCYLGQETVARLDARGHVNRLLRGVSWEAGPNDAPAIESGAQLRVSPEPSAKPTGEIHSVGWSPSLGRWLGLALVRVAQCEPGTVLYASTQEPSQAVTVSLLPFVRSTP